MFEYKLICHLHHRPLGVLALRAWRGVSLGGSSTLETGMWDVMHFPFSLESPRFKPRRRYVFSMDVARALVQVNAIAPLKFMPNEDSTFGFWVMNMDLRKASGRFRACVVEK